MWRQKEGEHQGTKAVRFPAQAGRAKSKLTRLIVTTAHCSYLHPGVATLLSILGDKFRIPGLRNFLKKVSRQCPICQRAYAQPAQQQMGFLPEVRTTPAPPFHSTGIDFAGPFTVRQGHTRRPVLLKSYACLLVCLVTRAVHGNTQAVLCQARHS